MIRIQQRYTALGCKRAKKSEFNPIFTLFIEI